MTVLTKTTTTSLKQWRRDVALASAVMRNHDPSYVCSMPGCIVCHPELAKPIKNQESEIMKQHPIGPTNRWFIHNTGWDEFTQIAIVDESGRGIAQFIGPMAKLNAMKFVALMEYVDEGTSTERG